jgi:hypothetical protein
MEKLASSVSTLQSGAFNARADGGVEFRRHFRAIKIITYMSWADD